MKKNIVQKFTVAKNICNIEIRPGARFYVVYSRWYYYYDQSLTHTPLLALQRFKVKEDEKNVHKRKS